MGFFSEDMLPMLGVYEAETSELIETLDAIVSRTEGKDHFEGPDVEELFRCMHTIKGSSAMMGLDTLSRFAHKVEDLFDYLRGEPELSKSDVAEIIDHLYSFSDYAKDELGRMGDDDYTPADAEGLIAGIASATAKLQGTSQPEAPDVGKQTNPASEQHDNSDGVSAGDGDQPDSGEESGTLNADEVTLKVSFNRDEAMVSARALVLIRQLGSRVHIASHVPDNLTDVSAAKVIAENGLLINVSPADVEEAKQFLAKNSFVRQITVLEEAGISTAASKDDDGGKLAEDAAVAEKFVKLKWSNVHNLQNMAGEFLLQASRLKAIAAETPGNTRLRDAVSQAARLVDDLVYHVNNMAMVSMSVMVPQLSRMVRDMCRSSDKQVSFTVNGGDIEIDRNLYNSISEPLLHIIRNAVDHGIEKPEERLAAGKEARGNVTLSVENLGSRVAFRVSDDGKGIDADRVLQKAEASGKLDKPASHYSRSEVLKMVMMPGLSTTNEVTKYSGRGVGMDVVSTVVNSFNGHVDIESEPGKGTSVTLYMPLSVASVASLVFRIGPSLFHMPLFNLSKIISAEDAADKLSRFEGSAMLLYEKRHIPVLDMHDVFDYEGKDTFYIVCQTMSEEFVIGVDDVVGEFECANKPLPHCLDTSWQLKCPIRNVSILEDGTVSYALHVAILASMAQGRNEQVDSQLVDFGDALPDTFGSADDGVVPSQAFVFALGHDLYAVPVDVVDRLIAMPAYTNTPHPKPYLLGLANFRNKALALFDLARYAGAEEASPYVLIVLDAQGNRVGLTISDAIGVVDFENAALTDDQPEISMFPGGLKLTSQVRTDPKEPPINIFEMVGR